MYKVFVNDSLICLLDQSDNASSVQTTPFDASNLIELIEKLEQEDAQEVFLLAKNLKKAWKEFRKTLNVKSAAGGKVKNSKGELLFIKRLGKWDLPKGHIEKGETVEESAIREVEEECGISGLKIESELPTTYHIFRRKGKLILKETFWFNMTTSFEGKLVPQVAEDITEVRFLNAENTSKALQNTYKNILLLFK